MKNQERIGEIAPKKEKIDLIMWVEQHELEELIQNREILKENKFFDIMTLSH